ncbi:MAG: hypothetical protein P4L67_05130 [Candidatus Pacebacteria bacterium]|nr:hypothetical protein [Candidatus Paceibacterota bacterium]
MAKADVVEPPAEVCKLRHTAEDGPPCVRIKVLGVTKIYDMSATSWNSDHPGSKWECEYELTRIDGSTVIRTANTVQLGSDKQPKSFGFDLS